MPDSSNELDAKVLMEVDLDEIGWKVLHHGLAEWMGPAQCTDELAVGMGFASIAGGPLGTDHEAS